MAEMITMKEIEALKAKDKAYPTKVGGRPGLWVETHPTGTKSWSVICRIADGEGGDKLARFNLGTIKQTKLSKAGKDAATIMAATLEERAVMKAEETFSRRGKRTSPNEDAAPDGVLTFGLLADKYLKRHASRNKKASSAHHDKLAIEREFKDWSARPADAITREDVEEKLERKFEEAEVAAERLRVLIRMIFGFGVEKRLIAESPAHEIKALVKASKIERKVTIPKPVIGSYVRIASALPAPFGPFLLLLAHLLQRRNEIAGMRWQDIDLDGDEPTWTIPADMTKASREQVVPLVPAVVEIIRSIDRVPGNPLVFPAESKKRDKPISGFSKLKRRIDGLIEDDLPEGVSLNDWRFHDWRRSGASYLASQRVPTPVLAALLNHSQKQLQGITAIYNLHQYVAERREALEMWSSHLEALRDGRDEGKVVKLREHA